MFRRPTGNEPAGLTARSTVPELARAFRSVELGEPLPGLLAERLDSGRLRSDVGHEHFRLQPGAGVREGCSLLSPRWLNHKVDVARLPVRVRPETDIDLVRPVQLMHATRRRLKQGAKLRCLGWRQTGTQGPPCNDEKASRAKCRSQTDRYSVRRSNALYKNSAAREWPAAGGEVTSKASDVHRFASARSQRVTQRSPVAARKAHLRPHQRRPSSDRQHQMPDRPGHGFHLDFDVVAEPIQAVHQLPLG